MITSLKYSQLTDCGKLFTKIKKKIKNLTLTQFQLE